MLPLTSAGVAPVRTITREACVVVVLALAAVAAGYLAVRDPSLAVVITVVPGAIWLFPRQRVLALMLAAAIPFAQTLAGGGLGLNVALSDLLVALLFLSIVAESLATRDFAVIRSLAPLSLPLLQYAVMLALLLAFHLSFVGLASSVQRLELFLLPLVIGAYAAYRGYERPVLWAYVLSATVLAATWPTVFSNGDALDINKNAAGQFIACAIVLLVGARSVRRLLPWCMPILVIGLFVTLSRGAITSVGVGLIALLLVRGGTERRRVALLIIPLMALTVLAFRLLPEDDQARTTTFTAGTETRAAYALKIREQYRVDAERIIAGHRWTGVGVGSYRAGTKAEGTIATDPHQVLLLEAAEGGYPLAVSFVVLVLGTGYVVVRRARKEPLAPVAIAVTAAVVGHGLVDVYWVRSTPLLGWVLIGMVLGGLAARRLDEGATA